MPVWALHVPPATTRSGCSRRARPGEVAGQRRLPGARLAGQEHHLALSRRVPPRAGARVPRARGRVRPGLPCRDLPGPRPPWAACGGGRSGLSVSPASSSATPFVSASTSRARARSWADWKAPVPLLVEASPHEPSKARTDVGVREGQGLLSQDRGHRLGRCLPPEGGLAAQHLAAAASRGRRCRSGGPGAARGPAPGTCTRECPGARRDRSGWGCRASPRGLRTGAWPPRSPGSSPRRPG